MPQAKDEADLAAEQEEFARTEARWQHGKFSRLAFRGRCHWCNEAIEGTFCDVDCRRDWEKDLAVRKRRGEAKGLGEHAQ